MPRPLRFVAAVVTAAAVLSGCGEEEPEVVDVGARVTSAADALECAEGATPKPGTVSDGSRQAHEDAVAAVRAWAERIQDSAELPVDGYRVAIEEVGKVLFTHVTDGRAEVAVVALRAEDGDGDLGWTVRSWASCRG